MGWGGGVGRIIHTEGGAYTKRYTHKAVCGHRRSHLIKGATGKAVHTQGGTHKSRPVATAGAMLLKGPQARRCTHKAEPTKGGLWPLQGGALSAVRVHHNYCGVWPQQKPILCGTLGIIFVHVVICVIFFLL